MIVLKPAIDKSRKEREEEKKLKEAYEYKEKVKYNGVKTESHHKLHNNKSVVKISEKKRQASRNTKKQILYKEIEENDNE